MTHNLFAWADARVREARAATPRDHEERWRAFVKQRPDVAARVLAWCRAQRDRGQRRVSMKRCWEELRGTLGAGAMLDNSFTAPAARWVVALDPTLRTLIVMKSRKGGAL